MNQALKNRLLNSCPLLKDMVPYLEGMETKSVAVEANVEKLVEHNLERVVKPWFVNTADEEAGFDVYDITENSFKCKAGSAGSVYYN